ncbi:DNA-binding response regulator [Dyadobacter beijingensis]|uniref:DNA-binding response regulator n=1 Tax=Dyadobacter beijingensis TaxID=365489 RepID=A0ABQ2IG15_9BACT|nr:response regulator transcription factor [Dyadobacter beijingensis]GGN06200.1 DNA-binding response regulator [Dyadobacter beijingensis]
MTLKVLIYEDNEALRDSMVTMLEWDKSCEVVGAMTDASFVKKDVARYRPDVVIMDIEMPHSNGVSAVRDLRTVNKDTPVLIFTVFEDDDNVFNAICAGANGYILKKNLESLQASVNEVLNGGAPMSGPIARKVLGFIPRLETKKDPALELLSKRENEILELLVKGYSYKMISSELVISVETVRVHIKSIYRKLHVNSATEAQYKVSQGRL